VSQLEIVHNLSLFKIEELIPISENQKPPGNLANAPVRPQSTSSHSSIVLSVDYETAHGQSKWMVLRKALVQVCYLPHRPNTLYFTLQHHSIHSVPAYTYAKPTRARQGVL